MCGALPYELREPTSRGEGLHTKVACVIYGTVQNKLQEDLVRSIAKGAVEAPPAEMQAANGQRARRQLRPVLCAGPVRLLLRWQFGAAKEPVPLVQVLWPAPLRRRQPLYEQRAVQQVQWAEMPRPPRVQGMELPVPKL